MATDLEGPGYHINRSNLLVIESKADMQKRGQVSPDDEDAVALPLTQVVAPAKVEEREELGGYVIPGPGAVSPKYRVGCDKAIYRIPGARDSVGHCQFW